MFGHSGEGSRSKGIGGGGMARIGDPRAGQVAGTVGRNGRWVYWDNNAVGVRHQAVEAAGGRSRQGQGRQENLQFIFTNLNFYRLSRVHPCRTVLHVVPTYHAAINLHLFIIVFTLKINRC